MKSPKPIFRFPKPEAGFALVVTLSLMILLTIVAVGLLTLSSISLRAASADRDVQTARQNARLALMIALGELQVHLGPDTRISARAETLAKDSRVASSVAPNSPKSWWVGVSDSDRTKTLGGSAPQPVVWLVSGLTGNSPGGQLGENFKDPVDMIGAGSLDLALTGGAPIQAGRVLIKPADKVTGAYAYFIDDQGMKAQLAASRAYVRNDLAASPGGGPLGGGVLPGTYPLDVLHQMDGLAGTDQATYLKLISTNNLPLIGLSKPMAKARFFSFTTSSQGVLSDVKNGGLKKDLTIAFENPTVFNSAFPSSTPDKYLLIDPKKRPGELAQGGYIHWAIFRDYYNLKKNLRTVSGIPTLAPFLFEKAGLLENATHPFHTGQLGPHAMGISPPPQHANHPYGMIDISPTKGGNPVNYLHNPITAILSNLQENAWVSQVPGQGTTPAKLRTHVQLFTSHYNPYNVGINMDGNNAAGVGPRVQKYPQVLFTVGSSIVRQTGLDAKLQAHAGTPVLLEPGRSHVLGFRTDGNVGQEIDGQLYSQEVGKIVNQSVRREHNATALPAANPVRMEIEFAFREPVLMQGMDEHPGDREVSQVFFSPFSWDSIPAFSGTSGPRPGKKFIKNIPASELNENSAVSLAFNLRTTKEVGSRLRPLVDANIRAIWNNPRWDSPLKLSLLAAFSEDSKGEAPQRQLQMLPGSGSRGFTYWGNDRYPSGANDRVILFDVPRRDLVSLGQLQHANAGRFSYEPTYIVGNSYANPRIPAKDWKAAITDSFSAARRLPWSIPGSFNLYDASYLVNEVMFDGYTFTTIPQANDNFGGKDVPADYTKLLAGTLHLPNPRYIPYRPQGSDFTSAQLKNTGTATTGSFFHNAGHLVVDGAFNVNSTSVDAWEAFLSGTHKLPVQKLNASGVITTFGNTGGVRFPRAASHLGVGMKTAAINDNYWTGFRELTQQEVRDIATELVLQIKQRGPFLTLGEFVNRKLETSDLGKSGALQAALDATVNKSLDGTYESAADSGAFANIPAGASQGAGFPGQLLQGDVLQALAPYMTVRSDTFTIRSYGESRSPDGKITARAYAEAVVQRVPDALRPSTGSKSTQEELARPTSPFGRRFQLISFRWLSPNEI